MSSPQAGDAAGRATGHRAVLLINLGTPERADVASVRRYLGEFLSDPEVIRLPVGLGWLNGPLGRLIARFRSPASTKMYERIWTAHGSPLARITAQQAAALEAAMPHGWRVFHAMRYGRPAIEPTLRRIEGAGVNELVVVPMYPQFSGPTTRTALNVLFKYLEHDNHPIQVTTRPTWHDDPAYIHAQATCIRDYAEAQGLTPANCYLLFSAHGLPVSYVKRGDPYPELVGRSVELVAERLGWPAERFSLAYQSRFGPVAWIRPFTDEVLGSLAAGGERRVLVCPISFTADCLETLEELGIRYRAEFESSGGRLYVCPALNASERFISALKELVLRGPRVAASVGGGTPPLMAAKAKTPAAAEACIDSLVMVGASLGSRVGPGSGPVLAHATPEGLRRVKRSQCEVPDLLQAVQREAGLKEAWLFNTCRRFELYGWTEASAGAAEPDRVVSAVCRGLFGSQPPADVPVNVLRGADAWHHLLRTAAGLNSGLPGEREIIEQLEAAHRLARCAGPAGPMSQRLLEDVVAIERGLRRDTDWGGVEPNYCHAALSRIAEEADLVPARCRIVVIGGSTTSASVLRTLIERFDVPARQLTLLYRGHKRGGQIKLLRKAIGGGQRRRVQSYSEPAVTRAVAEADLVVFGIDSERPVLSAGQLRGSRDFAARPLTVVDFNMFGSTDGLSGLDGVRLFTAAEMESLVTAYADELCASESFSRAVDAAEGFIRQRVDRVRRVLADRDTRATAYRAAPGHGEGGRGIPVNGVQGAGRRPRVVRADVRPALPCTDVEGTTSGRLAS